MNEPPPIAPPTLPGPLIRPEPPPLDPGLKWVLPFGRSPWAIAAGYLGLFSFIIFPAPISVIVSIIAIVHIKRRPGLGGMGRAIFGLIIGLLGTAILLFAWLS